MRNSLRTAVSVLAAATLLQAAAIAGGRTEEASYVEGTVDSIPRNTLGVLNLNDPANLVFEYGDPAWKLPYANITDLRLEQASPRSGRFGRLRSFTPFLHKSPRLAVAFQTEEGEAGNMVLELSRKSAPATLALLEERSGRKAASGPAVAAAQPAERKPEAWWGDQYWKTKRNADSWPKPPAEQASR
ncbi:MAG: hypothetical protein ACK5AZ_07540 [Bryobacteraceae bacterium]